MLGLTLNAHLEGVTDLQPKDSPEDPYRYSFKVECGSCREIHANWIDLDRFEQHELSGSRGEANFVWKCKNCKRESTASIKAAPKPYTLEDSGKDKVILEFDCRGCEFIKFRPDSEWVCKGAESNTIFDNISLMDGELFDYDEKLGQEISITDIRWEIKRV